MAHSSTIGDLEESVAQRQEKINAACASLIESGAFFRELFTIKNVHENGYNVKEFIEYVTPLTSITDLELLSLLLYSDHKVWCSPWSATFRQFLDFIKWLNGEKGKKAKADAALKISKMNLEKKEMTKNDLALAQMLVDYAASRQKARNCIGNEIEELKKRQKELEMECANIEADLKTKLGPIYEYKGPSIHELRIEAYKLYVADCLSKKITPLPRHHEMAFEKAMEGFGATVKERNLVKYLNDPVRKEIIRDFFKQKILRIEYAGYNKSQSREDYDSFHNFAVAVCGEEASNESQNIVHKFACDVTGGGCATASRF